MSPTFPPNSKNSYILSDTPPVKSRLTLMNKCHFMARFTFFIPQSVAFTPQVTCVAPVGCTDNVFGQPLHGMVIPGMTPSSLQWMRIILGQWEACSLLGSTFCFPSWITKVTRMCLVLS